MISAFEELANSYPNEMGAVKKFSGGTVSAHYWFSSFANIHQQYIYN